MEERVAQFLDLLKACQADDYYRDTGEFGVTAFKEQVRALGDLARTKVSITMNEHTIILFSAIDIALITGHYQAALALLEEQPGFATQSFEGLSPKDVRAYEKDFDESDEAGIFFKAVKSSTKITEELAGVSKLLIEQALILTQGTFSSSNTNPTYNVISPTELALCIMRTEALDLHMMALLKKIAELAPQHFVDMLIGQHLPHAFHFKAPLHSETPEAEDTKNTEYQKRLEESFRVYKALFLGICTKRQENDSNETVRVFWEQKFGSDRIIQALRQMFEVVTIRGVRQVKFTPTTEFSLPNAPHTLLDKTIPVANETEREGFTTELEAKLAPRREASAAHVMESQGTASQSVASSSGAPRGESAPPATVSAIMPNLLSAVTTARNQLVASGSLHHKKATASSSGTPASPEETGSPVTPGSVRPLPPVPPRDSTATTVSATTEATSPDSSAPSTSETPPSVTGYVRPALDLQNAEVIAMLARRREQTEAPASPISAAGPSTPSRRPAPPVPPPRRSPSVAGTSGTTFSESAAESSPVADQPRASAPPTQ